MEYLSSFISRGRQEAKQTDPHEQRFRDELPEKIDFDCLGDLDAIQDEFEKGVEDIETQFHALVERTQKNFDEKHSHLRVIYRKMYKNHQFMASSHEKRLEECKALEKKVKDEKLKWQQEKDLIAQNNFFSDEMVELEVSGEPMKIAQDTLCSVPGSLLYTMFSGKHELKKQDDKICLDRDPKSFEAMINYLRNKRLEYPKFEDYSQKELFDQELDHWGIQTMDDNVEEKRLIARLPQELIEYMSKEPEKACMEARKKWRELGPLKFIDIEKYSKVPKIDTTLKFGQSSKYSNFTGQLDGDGNVNGVGRYIINNGTIYEGQIFGYQMSGFGRFIYTNGDFYLGQFHKHKKNGQGAYHFNRSGKVQEGLWANDKFCPSASAMDSTNVSIVNQSHAQDADGTPLKSQVSLMEFTRSAFKGRSNSLK